MYKTILQDFLNDKQVQELQSNLEVLKKEQSQSFNIFKVLKLDNHEIRHSNFLAWLLNPKENHGCGDKFLKQFLQEALGNNIGEVLPDTSDIVVETEYMTNAGRRIDILIHSQKSSFVCVIENKYGSCEHDEQCKHYKDFIEKFSDFKAYGRKYFIFLDIYNPESKVMETTLMGYNSITYKNVYEILNNLWNEKSFANNDSIQSTVYQYLEIIKEKYKMLDTEIKNQCRNIYAKYPEVLETLEQYNKELQQDIYNIMKDVLADKTLRLANADISGCGYNDRTGCGIRFIPEKFSLNANLKGNNKLTKYNLFYALEYKKEMSLSIYDEQWKCYKQVKWSVASMTDEDIKTTMLVNINNLQEDFSNIITGAS